MSDPRVVTVPVRECREPLWNVRTETELLLDERRQDPADAFAHLRSGLVERLMAAQDLLPKELRLLIIEGYRPLALQRQYFESYHKELITLHPGWKQEQLYEAASRYVSPPEIAPHSAGAAVDLTLCTTELTELDMGTPVNANPEDSDDACYTAAPDLDPTPRANRQLLCRVLSTVGLVNYPTEWWHWSYGDRYWAMAVGAQAARYGPLGSH